MKKKICTILLLSILCTGLTMQAQLQQDNLMVGGSIMDFNTTFGKYNSYSFRLNPKVGYFIQNNVALGGYLDINVAKQQSSSAVFSYGLGVFGRYYFGGGETYNPLNDGRFFGELQFGLSGVKDQVGINLAPAIGYAYFISPNVSVEAMAQLHSSFGVGTNTGIRLGVGFQIYLPTSKLKQELEKVRKETKPNYEETQY